MNFEEINKALPESEQQSYAVHKALGAIYPQETNQDHRCLALLRTSACLKGMGILNLAVHPGIIQTDFSRHASLVTSAAVWEY